MGSTSSKTAPKGVRKFPSRYPVRSGLPPASQTVPAPAEKLDPVRPSNETKNTSRDTSHADVSAAFSDRLHKMGIVDPNPTFSATSTAYQSHSASHVNGNASRSPTLVALEARRQIQQAADAEMEHNSSTGHSRRRFLPVATISKIISLQQDGHGADAIENQLKLEHGVVASLGTPGVVVSLQ